MLPPLLCLLLMPAALAQTTAGALEGFVQDQSGARIRAPNSLS